MRTALFALPGLGLTVFGNLYDAPFTEAIGGALLMLGVWSMFMGSRAR